MGLSANDHEKRIERIFREEFDSTPKLYFSPGRINIIGEHVDYNNGWVLPAAIDKGIYFALAPNQTSQVNVQAPDLGQELSFSLHDIQKNKGWKNYILGVTYQLNQESYSPGGFDCVFGGDLPSGAGMSSSAAVECGLATALNDVFSLGIGRMTIAKICQKAEHEFPGVMCGIMDQFANMMGKRDHVMLLDCRSLEYRYLPMPLDDYSILMINTKVHHALGSSEYNLRREQCEEGVHIISKHLPDIHSLRDIKENELCDFIDLMPSETFQKCLFVIQEISRTRQAAKLLEQGRLQELGRLLFDAHEGLSKLYKVSCDELDFLVEEASREPAVIGSRMMGGGFGGCTINIIRKEAANHFFERTAERYKKKFNINAEAYEVKLGDGTHKLDFFK
jgi:galactokinase